MDFFTDGGVKTEQDSRSTEKGFRVVCLLDGRFGMPGDAVVFGENSRGERSIDVTTHPTVISLE